MNELFTIYSKKNRDLLINLYNAHLIDGIICELHKDLFSATLEIDVSDIDVEIIAHILINYILNDNPIIKSSNTILTFVLDKVGDNIHRNLTNDLLFYIKSDNYLDLDGFICFRLQNYTHDVNLILYQIAKKSLQNFNF